MTCSQGSSTDNPPAEAYTCRCTGALAGQHVTVLVYPSLSITSCDQLLLCYSIVLVIEAVTQNVVIVVVHGDIQPPP